MIYPRATVIGCMSAITQIMVIVRSIVDADGSEVSLAFDTYNLGVQPFMRMPARPNESVQFPIVLIGLLPSSRVLRFERRPVTIKE